MDDYEQSEQGKAKRAAYRASEAGRAAKKRFLATDQSKEWSRRTREARQTYVNDLKRAPCVDCGNTFDPICMDFDHRPGEIKKHDVSRLVRSGSITSIAAEIARCDLVCANCHRMRTHKRGYGLAGYVNGNARKP